MTRHLTVTAGTFADRLDCAALLFDLDGTLVDSSACVRGTWLAWCRRHGLDATRLFAVSEGRRNRDTIGIVAPHLDIESEVATLVEAEESCRDVTAITGARALLSSLPADRWAIVTSAWRRLAEIRLDLAGLPTPAVLVTADDVGKGKPDPEGYLAAAAALGAGPADCVVFEDAPAGLAAAAAAGARAVQVGEQATPPCRWRVPDLATVRVEVAE